jgi:hypothetical protein
MRAEDKVQPGLFPMEQHLSLFRVETKTDDVCKK